jgi:F0F1-type ATP synthase assembly protein I
MPKTPGKRLTSLWAQVGFYTSLGFILPAGALGGLLVGWLLDDWLHTSPVFAIIMTLGGVTGALIEILRILARAEKHVDGSNSGNGAGSG